MYPGEGSDWSKGGSKSRTRPSSSRTRSFHPESKALVRAIRVGGAAQPSPRLGQGIDPRLLTGRRPQECAVIEDRPKIPFPIPGRSLDLPDQGLPLLLIGPSPFSLIQQLQTAQPYPAAPPPETSPARRSLPFAPGTHPIQPIVPIPRPDQRQPTGPALQAAFFGTATVLEERGTFQGRPPVCRNCSDWPPSAAAPRGRGPPVAESPHHRLSGRRARPIAATTAGSSESATASPRPSGDATSAARHPLELAAGREQDVPARQLRRGMDQRHHILQLVAKAKGAAGLIKGGAAPDAADRLWYSSQRFISRSMAGSGVRTSIVPNRSSHQDFVRLRAASSARPSGVG